MDMQEPKDMLTVLITSSPAHTHPSTSLLDHVLDSFQEIPSLVECRKIIICDGYKIDTKARYKKGRVTQEHADSYEQYKRNLKKHISDNNPIYKNVEILELPVRVGFGFALKEALPIVTTKYLMIVQHDRSFIKSFDLQQILESMEINPQMRCVLLPLASTYNYRKRMDTKFGKKDILNNLEIVHNNHTFLPLCQFYDSTHIAHMDFYKDFIIGQKMIPKNGFIEDRLGQLQVKDIRENGMDVHGKYGTYLYGDGFEYLVQHLDGRDGLTENQFTWQRDDKGLYRRIIHNVPFHTREEASVREAAQHYSAEVPEGTFDFLYAEIDT